MSKIPVLTLALLSVSNSTNGFVYLSHTIARASKPLRTFPDASMPQCAVWCRMSEGCVKWSHDPSTRLCELWPLHSPNNPLTESPVQVYQPILPDGFIMSDDPTIAYKQRAFSIVGGRDSIISSCHEYDPESFPAFPNTERQVTYLKANVIGSYFWIGVWDQETEGVFKDMTSGQVVELPAVWWWNGVVDTSTSYNCLTLYSRGLYAVPCGSTRNGHICQYYVQTNSRRPLREKDDDDDDDDVKGGEGGA